MLLRTVSRTPIQRRVPFPAALLVTVSAVLTSASPGYAQGAGNQRLMNCLCSCQRPPRSEFSCTYDPNKKGGSPSCDNPANGPCICEALGCFRTALPAINDCSRACAYKASPWTGSVQAVSGDVSVQHYGATNWVPLTKGMMLNGGDRVRTGKDGRIAIAWNRDGTAEERLRVTLMASTEFFCDTYVAQAAKTDLWKDAFAADHPVLHLIKGKLKALTGSLFGSEWKHAVQSKNSVCGIRGTEFIVQYDVDRITDSYYVHSGTVDVTAATGTARVGSGKQLVVTRGGVLGTVRPLDEATWTTLSREFDMSADPKVRGRE